MNPTVALALKYVVGILLFLVWLAASATPPWAGITIGQPILGAIFLVAWGSLGLGAYQGLTAVRTNWITQQEAKDAASRHAEAAAFASPKVVAPKPPVIRK
jgi:type IV secretory pathway TrbL component